MSLPDPEPVVALRRSWPQRLLILASLAVIAGLVIAALSLREFDVTAASIPRVDFDLAAPDGEPVVVEAGEPVNFLIVGTDNAEGLDPDDPVLNDRQTDSLLTDVLMVLRLDPITGQAAVLSIPRDLRVDYASGGSGKVNAAYYYGTQNGNGHAEVGQTIVDNLDIPIHKYVEINFLGFAQLADAIGGVPVNFEYAARDLGSGLDVPEAGCWILEGSDALAYVRGRNYEEYIEGEWVFTGGDDFKRNTRQQDFLVLGADRAVSRVGRSPSAIRQFLKGVQDARAVTLDDETSLQELIDLAQAFAEFNPESLQRYSLPLGLISGTSDYEILDTQAQPVLDVFRGFDGLGGASSVSMTATGDEEEAGYLADRGFVLTEVDVDSVTLDIDEENTTLFVSDDQQDAARVVGSWLTQLPPVVVVDGEKVVHLHIGDDYAGSRLVPRLDNEEVFVEWQGEHLTPPMAETSIPTSADTSTSASTTTQDLDGSVDGSPDDEIDSSTPTTTTEPTVRGKPPDGADCKPLA